MDISRLADLSEIFGTAAIIVSLVYVAVQIKQSTQAMRLNAAQNVSRDLQNSMSHIASDTGLAGIHLQGMRDVDSLAPAERHRFYNYVWHFLRTMENAYYQNKAGALEPYVWEGMEKAMSVARATSGYSAFWNDRKQFFSEEFQYYYGDIRAADAQVATGPFGEVSKRD